MLNESIDSLIARAEELAARLREALGVTGEAAGGQDLAMPVATFAVEKAASKVGGGALPLLELDSFVCAISPTAITVDDLAARLRETDPPVIGRIHKERLLLDVRTILPSQIEMTAAALRQALSPGKPSRTILS